MVDSLLGVLCEDLDYPVKQQIISQIDNMMRAILFQAESNNEKWVRIEKHGYTIPKLVTIVTLGAFYQTVLGPLSSTARSKHHVGSTTPLHYGKQILVDSEENEKIDKCIRSFKSKTNNLGIPFPWLYVYRGEDLISRIARHLEENE